MELTLYDYIRMFDPIMESLCFWLTMISLMVSMFLLVRWAGITVFRFINSNPYGDYLPPQKIQLKQKQKINWRKEGF